MCCSLIIPGLAHTFQRPMLDFNGIRAQPLRVHVAGVVVLFVAVELLYLLTLFTSPGFVRLDPSGADRAGAEGTREEAAAASSTCKKCHVSRPARSHHCSICRRCVLRMDHHW